jgi:cytochrome P450
MSEELQSLPEGPSKNLFLSLLLYVKVVSSPYDGLLKLQEKFGDTFPIRVIGNPGVTIFTGNPQYVKEIFALHPDHFTMMDTHRIQFFFGKRSLFTSEGDTHQKDKKLIFPHFRGERMRAYATTIQECIRKLCDQRLGQGVFSITDLAQSVTIETMLQALLGVRKAEHLDKLINVFMNWNDAQSPFLGIPALQTTYFKPYRDFIKTKTELGQFIQSLIKENRLGEGGADILSLMVRSRYEDGSAMEDEHITDHMRSLFIAGFDTTANTISWGLDTIFRNPQLLAKLREEIDSLPEDGDIDEMAKLPYLDATCYELMRLNPPLEIIPTRKLSKPMQLGPHLLEPGTGLMPCPILTQRNPELYPEPNAFKPERFLGKRPNVFEYFPFGGGRRLCAGYAFANYQMRLVIGTAIKEYDISLQAEAPKATKRYSVVTGPSGRVPAIITRRAK